ncbi:putative amidoligase domain-containing protein [Heyndrickxia oleronia]|uniref:YheC/YheD family protein n=1 Tax=Heyndrickxia oleronia TaxID=38875 RepID=A0AAW6SPY4_9BACI|nr:YheC/YheD family protein [Heyndrickxia oleronia]MDH5160824.1 YheC/YheD family protein [Heyndrickxia oleronia]
MISFGEQFFLANDKESILQTLNINHVPSVELVDPKYDEYPLIGRKYGQHNGKDIFIINSYIEGEMEKFDYFTKLYSIEKEYCLEIKGLKIMKVNEAISKRMIFNEIPIRTSAYGWCWENTEIDDIPFECLEIAVRALYVVGMTCGTVKIGKLANQKMIVLDIHPSEDQYFERIQENDSFTIGADIEFMLSCDGDLIPASHFYPLEGAIGCDERQMEKDSGHYVLGEIRPNFSQSPRELFTNIEKLIEEAARQIPYENIEIRAGSMPFTGYQCGGHIHFGMPISLSLLRALDQYLAIPLAIVECPEKAKLRRKTKHGGLGRYRVKSYGFEYLSLSSWITDPKLTKSVLFLAKLVAEHHHELICDYLYHPVIQQAYYSGNRFLLRKIWGELKERLMRTTSFTQYQNELDALFSVIEEGNIFEESIDIRRNWGIGIPKEIYDPGCNIQIPKGTRMKFNLQVGDKAFVSAGKEISTATIQPYPFSFRDSNRVYLSKKLRERLIVPNDWHPRISMDNGAIILGPIIGILAARPFDRQTTYFHHLMRIADERKMLVYVFEPQDIIWDRQLIRGTALTGEGIFPFPSVIYDRYFIGNETNIDINDIRMKLQSSYHIPFVNSQKLFTVTGNKWDTHQLLMKEHDEYLPDTCLLEKQSEITDMLNQYGEIYLKPIGGSMSMGVIRVIRRPTGIFWFDFSQNTTQQLSSTEELNEMAMQLMKKSSYIIQEGIRRKQVDGKNLEIRVYMQKNGQQKWLRTGMVSRMTAEEVLTEETERNVRLSKILSKIYPNPLEKSKITQQLAEVSKRVVTTLEKEVGSFGELAVDLCIDQYDSVKLLEINAKPDNLFSQIKAYKLRNIAGLRLINYAASLAGYDRDEGGGTL